MKVAVTAESCELNSRIDPRFGRAACFVVVDTETGQIESQDNRQSTRLAQGAGTQAAQDVISLGASAVITGNVGPKAFEALRSDKVSVYLVYAGTVKAAVDRLKAGRLVAAEKPTRQGHWR